MKKNILSILLLSTSVLLVSSCSKNTNENLDDKKYLDRVQTLDSTLEYYYAAISTDNGKSLDWDFYRYVTHPDSKLVRYGREKDGNYSIVYYSADDYIDRYSKYMEKVGFYEKEIGRGEVTTFGNISHVFSAYASFEKGSDKPIIRGVNSFQLLNDGKRWWIINAYFTRETKENPIPKEYFLKQ